MKRRGFTLVEILTTIFIFGVLVSVTGYVYGTSLARSRDTQRKTDLNTIKTTLEQYYLENREYPENTSYKTGLSSHPHVAKYELERYILDGCDSGEDDPDKKFLAPNYITTIPEDPQRKIQNSLSNNCQLIPIGGNAAGYGQYIYASQINSEGEKARRYTLLARLERTTFVNEEVFSIDPSRYALTTQKVNDWGYTFCSKNQSQDPTRPACSYNYYLSTSNND